MKKIYPIFCFIIFCILSGYEAFADGIVQYVCPGTSNYSVTSTLTGSTFTWTITPGNAGVDWTITGQGTSSVTINWITPNTDPGYTMTVQETASSANGNCQGTVQTATIFVNSMPTVNQPSDIVICNGAVNPVVTFSGTATGYTWTNSNTSIGLAASGTGNLPSFTASNTGNTAVTANITVFPAVSNGGTTCPGTPKTFTITVNPSPSITATPSSEAICSGATTNISFSSTTAGTTFSWTVVNESGITGSSSGSGSTLAQTISNSNASPATATYTVTPSANSCTGTPATVVVTVNPIPGTSGIILAAPSNKLQSLTVQSGANPVTLTPSFSSTTYTYSSTVAYSKSSVTVTPTSVEANSTITVNGLLTANGTESLPVNLNIGSNSITIIVTSCTGTTQTYTLNINRLGSTDLTSLTLSAGTLNPSFSSGTVSYSCAVSYDVSSVTVTPSAEEVGASITVNGTTVASGAASGSISLATGSNIISIIVTSSTGASKTYNVTITRDGDNFLQNLILKRGISGLTLSPPFLRTQATYSTSCAGTPLSVIPTAEEGSATITVNGSVVNSGQTASVPLNLGSNTVTIIVTPSVGSSRTYTVTVMRTS